jgi:hypothetical protein
LVVALFAACSSSSSSAPGRAQDDGGPDAAVVAEGGTGPLSDGGNPDAPLVHDADAASTDFCTAIAARASMCGDSPSNGCAAQQTCYESGFRPGVAAGLEACLTQRQCNTSDDPCFANAAAVFKDEPAVVSYRTACNDKRTGCAAADAGNFADDYCGVEIGLLPTAVVTDLETCFQLACGAVKSCFQQKVAAIGCGK